MSTDPLDTVIGSDSTLQRDREASALLVSEAKDQLAEGDRPAAVATLRRAVAADQESTDAVFKLAYVLDLMGEEDEAISLYERCIETPPAPINALINLAVLYEDRGEYVRAERSLRQVLDTNPNHPRAQLFMKDVQASREMVIEEESERDVMKRKAMLDTPVTDFELSVRARTCLKKMNIRTLGDLLRITEAELMSYRNFGESSLDEIKKMLTARNLRLGQGLEDAHRAARRQIMEKLKGSGKEAALGKSVSDLQLSVRARKALQLLNIQTLGDLASHTEAELMGVKNFGATSLVEVREKLSEYGLELRKLDEDEIAALGGMAAVFGDLSEDIDDEDDAEIEVGDAADIGIGAEIGVGESVTADAGDEVVGAVTADADADAVPAGTGSDDAPESASDAGASDDAAGESTKTE